MIRRAPACYRRAPACCRRALACCCTLAVLLAAALPAAAAASPAIAHRCSNALFRYTERYPIGYFGWHYDVPPEYIPGAMNPTNAPLRLTADTRLAFVGSFDAYFRRLMASVCFGTAECTNIAVGSPHYADQPTVIRLTSPAEWCSDHTITNIFNRQTNGWYLAGHRNYAVTNITVTATNWIGYATNIVYNPAGKPVGVKIENRYEITTTNILDTTRILYRYLRDHDAMRVKIDNPIRSMMVPTGFDDFDRPVPDPWPDRLYFRLGPRELDHWIKPEDFLGWTFSSAASLAPAADWQPSLVELFTAALAGGFAYFYPTTWDLFGAQNSRDAVARDLRDEAYAKYIDYDTVCPDDWDAFVAYMSGQGIADGYSAMTNLVGVSFTTNTTDGLAFLPSQPLTNSTRIDWAPWAGTDAYLALCDTSIAGNAVMPHLRYSVLATNATASASFHGSNSNAVLVVHSWLEGSPGFAWVRKYAVTNQFFAVSAGSPTTTPGEGLRGTAEQRLELIHFPGGGDVDLSLFMYASPADTGSSQLMHNGVKWPISRVDEWLEDLARGTYTSQPTPLFVGDIVSFSPGGDEATTPGMIIGSVFSGGGGQCGWYSPEYFIEFYAPDVELGTEVPVTAATSDIQPFDYAFAATTNSLPCAYPHPSFAGVGKVEEVAQIYPTALSAIGVSTNFAYEVDDPLDDGSFIVPDPTNGYYFALSTPSASADDAMDVDSFFAETDDALADKMRGVVEERSGVSPGPSAPASAAATLSEALASRLGPRRVKDIIDGICSNVDYQAISTALAWYPGGHTFPTVRITDVTTDGYNYFFQWEAVYETNGTYAAYSPQPTYVAHTWQAYLSGVCTESNVVSSAAARGRLSGIEAVKWNFKAMHDARSTQSSAPLRVLPGGAPAADSLTTQPPNR